MLDVGLLSNEDEKQLALPSHNGVTVSFLLVNYNTAELALRCVENIQRALPEGVRAEILIADNSSDPEFRLSPGAAPGATIVPCENKGWIDALNRLLPLTTGQNCVLMHTDVELAPGCLESLVAFLENHPEVGIVSPDLYYPGGSPCKIRTRFPTLRTEAATMLNHVARALLGCPLFAEQPCWDRRADVRVDMVMSVCMVIRRDLLDKIGRIDPRLRTYYANDFLAAKAAQLGYSCFYVHAARAIHFERFTASDLSSQSVDMTYKKDAFSSLAVMQADYVTFLRALYPGWKVLAFRGLLLLQDATLLATQLKSFRSRERNIRHVLSAMQTLCSFTPRFSSNG